MAMYPHPRPQPGPHHRRLMRPVVAGHALLAERRSPARDIALATVLAWVAGAANAGGFFAIGAYTSHVTGYLSALADHLVLWNLGLAATSLLAVVAFVSGAAFCTLLIRAMRRYDHRQQYALPVAVQGVFLLCFAGGGWLTSEPGRLFSLWCLCFIMGMQNATITKISGARIRTTHATGMVTDIGIELGRAAWGVIDPASRPRPQPGKLRLLVQLVGAFLLGGLTGAFGYGHFGFFFSVPLALVLLSMSLPSLILWQVGRRRGRVPGA